MGDWQECRVRGKCARSVTRPPWGSRPPIGLDFRSQSRRGSGSRVIKSRRRTSIRTGLASEGKRLRVGLPPRGDCGIRARPAFLPPSARSGTKPRPSSVRDAHGQLDFPRRRREMPGLRRARASRRRTFFWLSSPFYDSTRNCKKAAIDDCYAYSGKRGGAALYLFFG